MWITLAVGSALGTTPGPIPGSEMRLWVVDLAGNPVDLATLDIRMKYDGSPHRDFDYDLWLRGPQPYLVPIVVPGHPSTAVVVAVKDRYLPSEPLLIRSEWFHDAINPYRPEGVQEWLLEHTFVLTPTGEPEPPPPPPSVPPSVALEAPPFVLEFEPATVRAVVDAPESELEFRWTGGILQGARAEQVVMLPEGMHDVEVEVTHRQRGVGRDTARIVVANAPPDVRHGADRTTRVDEPIRTTVLFVDSAADDGPWDWTIDWGDGSRDTGSEAYQAGFGAEHAWTTPGTYGVRVCVTDRDGEAGCDDRTVRVGP